MRFTVLFATFAAFACTASSSNIGSQEDAVARVCSVNSPDPRACDPADTSKTTVCHVPPGNPANAHTICVGNAAVPAHLAHGDFLGTCICDGSGSDGTGSDGTGSDGTGSDGTGSVGTGSDGTGSGSDTGSGTGSNIFL